MNINCLKDRYGGALNFGPVPDDHVNKSVTLRHLRDKICSVENHCNDFICWLARYLHWVCSFCISKTIFSKSNIVLRCPTYVAMKSVCFLFFAIPWHWKPSCCWTKAGQAPANASIYRTSTSLWNTLWNSWIGMILHLVLCPKTSFCVLEGMYVN